MKKAECEAGIRYLCGEWSRLSRTPMTAETMPSFYDFYTYVQNNYPQYLQFRSSTSVESDVERWFDDEFNQNWRN